MAEPINLCKARKIRAKVQKRKSADENAVKFGRTKAERARDRSETSRANTVLDQHKREP